MRRRYPSEDRGRHPVIACEHRDRSSPETGARARGCGGAEAGRVHAFGNLSPKSQDKYLLPQSQPVQKISSGRIGGPAAAPRVPGRPQSPWKPERRFGQTTRNVEGVSWGSRSPRLSGLKPGKLLRTLFP